MAILRRLALALAITATGMAAAMAEDVKCDLCEEWNQPQQPFRIVGNTYYVGPRGLSAVLVTGDQGHILLDGALPQSAPLIMRNIAVLGFRIEDVKLIVNSHAHGDHAGGIAQLQRASGATVAASVLAARALRAGLVGPDDPQYKANNPDRFPKVAQVTEVADGGVLRVGALAVTAHLTPGHTTGGTTWSWQSCENGRCFNVVYADSLNPMSQDGFRFLGNATEPDRSASFQASIDKIAALKCDVMIAVHPGFSNLLEKHAARTSGSNPFIVPGECRTYAASAHQRLAKRIKSEASQ
ncbi:subclass B3 metallo-beta-lactamase [Massilia pseudoviolaceinigra]|uniref:subclass B3 metallo-beta-lactamase n=1 Tax=Massilia pseudoviolaceinigra TaxID=3057165 RepID=UPI002796E00F|nr:subclass B3 metallo-beta-lactamase [Massilia sp. CCM 9206]MDQ1919957.1 subclass B3 metallo-beta-lactamase [Massilia sp. CCM 9206]